MIRFNRLRLKAAVRPREVIVGAQKLANLFLQIDADDKGTARSQRSPHQTQKPHGFCRSEVADGRTRKKPKLGVVGKTRGQDHALRKIADKRTHLQSGKPLLKAMLCFLQGAVRDIYRQIGRQLWQPLQE